MEIKNNAEERLKVAVGQKQREKTFWLENRLSSSLIRWSTDSAKISVEGDREGFNL